MVTVTGRGDNPTFEEEKVSKNLTARWLENGGPGLIEDVFPIKDGDIPACYVSVCQSTFRIDTPFNKHVTWKSGNPPRAMGTAYEPGSKLLVLGMAIQPLIGILIMGI